MRKILIWMFVFAAAFAALSEAALAQSAPENAAVYSLGDKNDGVRAMKKRLQALGYFSKDTTIGPEFTESTERAVRKFQAQNGLPETGEADEKTLSLLNAADAVPAGATARPALSALYDENNPPPSDEEKVEAAVRDVLAALFPLFGAR